MSDRIQINIRSDEEEKEKWNAAAEADPNTSDLTSWIRKNCNIAYSEYKSSKTKTKRKLILKQKEK